MSVSVIHVCMWLCIRALGQNNYQKQKVASMLSHSAWQTLRHSTLYAPDYTLFQHLQHVPPFRAELYDQYDLVLRDDLHVPGERVKVKRKWSSEGVKE